MGGEIHIDVKSIHITKFNSHLGKSNEPVYDLTFRCTDGGFFYLTAIKGLPELLTSALDGIEDWDANHKINTESEGK